LSNRRKDIFYSVSLACTESYGSGRCVKDLCYPVMGRCQPKLVTWLTTLSKCRNQSSRSESLEVQVDTLVTAHNDKLCDKGVSWVPDSSDLRFGRFQDSAIRKELVKILRSRSIRLPWVEGPRSGSRTPPPYQKFPDQPPHPPLLPVINWSLCQNPFSLVQGHAPYICVAVHDSSFPPPSLSLAGQGGSGGILVPWFGLAGGPGGCGC
jgi:hypothetical protein